MIYKLKASRRKFEVLNQGEKETKVRFLDRAVDDPEVLVTDDLEASSDYKRPPKEENKITPAEIDRTWNDYYYGV